jgi:uroporphyrinogen III methyltransferase/synthase
MRKKTEEKRAGTVYLVGAGPGDISLLTLKGLRCLEKADVVVYDFHVNAQVLNFVRGDAEFVYAGKRGGHHAMAQDEINLLLVERAREGKIVCRLKGGDPLVFGRGGEEAEVLARAGIPFEIVPGVSAVNAVPAYAGIPLTHRTYSSSFAVVTGNEAATKSESVIYWEGLSKGYDTLVFLMGVKNVGTIADRLIAHGRPADTPAALVRWGTRPDQKTIAGTLGTIAKLVNDGGLHPPALLIVGRVVELRKVLRWYEEKPLFGHRVLITRQHSTDYRPLEELGAELFEFPTIQIAPPSSYDALDAAIERVVHYHWIVFTSPNGVKYFLRRYLERGRDIRDLVGVKLCAVGSRTAEAIAGYGMKVDLVPAEFSAEGLVDAFSRVSRTGGGLEGVRILLPRAQEAREVFPAKVRQLGGEIDAPAAYRSVKPEKHGKLLKRFLMEGKITIATFTSGATFTNFLSMMGDDALPFLHDIALAAIGPVTRKTIEKSGLKVTIMPAEATIEAMVESIIEWATRKQ